MLVHELGHVAVAAVLGRAVCTIRLLPVGFNAEIAENDLKGFNNILVYLGGPAVNLSLAASGHLISAYYLNNSNNMTFFIYANIYLALFNLLPVLPLDGGVILREIIAGRAGIFSASRHIKNIGNILAAGMILLGTLQFMGNKWNFSMILIGMYVFFSSGKGETEAAIMNVKSIIYRRARLLKKGIYQVRHLVAIKTMHMSEILKNLDFDRFHIVYVLDESLNVIKVLTEQQIIDGMLKYNSELTFEEFINKESVSEDPPEQQTKP